MLARRSPVDVLRATSRRVAARPLVGTAFAPKTASGGFAPWTRRQVGRTGPQPTVAPGKNRPRYDAARRGAVLPQNKQCASPLDTNIGSARAVLEAAALGADVATVGLAAGGITGPAALGTKALGYLFEAGIGAVNAYDAYANGNYGPLAEQGASIGARLIPGGRAFQSGLKAARGSTGILRNSAGRFRSSYLNNPAVKEVGGLGTQKAVGGAAGAVVCPNG